MDTGWGPSPCTRAISSARLVRLRLARLVDAPGQRRDRRRFEQRPDRQRHPEGFGDPGQYLARQQRMTAQIEEIVEDADVLDLEQIGPDAGQDFLGGVARRHELAARDPEPLADRHQCGPVDLAMSGQRHALQEDEARGDHVARKPGLEEIAKLVDLRLPAGRGDDVRDQPRLAAEVIPRQHDGGLDVRVLHEDVLDLLELDPVAADLHLVVDAAEKLERPVGAPAGQISGPVQARRGGGSRTGREESFAGSVPGR